MSVYMDDITVSGPEQNIVQSAFDTLQGAADTARFSFNAGKVQSPGPSVKNFNLEFGSGEMLVTAERMDKFKDAFDGASPYKQMGIYGYVWTVDVNQAEELDP